MLAQERSDTAQKLRISRGRVRELEAQEKDESSTVTGLQAKIARLEKQNETLLLRAQEAQATASGMQSQSNEASSLRKQNANLQKQLDKAQVQRERLEDDLRTSQEDVRALQMAVASREKTIQSLRAEVAYERSEKDNLIRHAQQQQQQQHHQIGRKHVLEARPHEADDGMKERARKAFGSANLSSPVPHRGASGRTSGANKQKPKNGSTREDPKVGAKSSQQSQDRKGHRAGKDPVHSLSRDDESDDENDVEEEEDDFALPPPLADGVQHYEPSGSGPRRGLGTYDEADGEQEQMLGGRSKTNAKKSVMRARKSSTLTYTSPMAEKATGASRKRKNARDDSREVPSDDDAEVRQQPIQKKAKKTKKDPSTMKNPRTASSEDEQEEEEERDQRPANQKKSRYLAATESNERSQSQKTSKQGGQAKKPKSESREPQDPPRQPAGRKKDGDDASADISTARPKAKTKRVAINTAARSTFVWSNGGNASGLTGGLGVSSLGFHLMSAYFSLWQRIAPDYTAC